MSLIVPANLLEQIQAHGEEAYPEEGAGLLLGKEQSGEREVVSIFSLAHAREDTARFNRYLLTPEDYAHGEQEAARLGLEVIGIFHSHPDHPNQPSEYDREWAMPWFSYLITSVLSGHAVSSRSWQLKGDRSQFIEQELLVTKGVSSNG